MQDFGLHDEQNKRSTKKKHAHAWWENTRAHYLFLRSFFAISECEQLHGRHVDLTQEEAGRCLEVAAFRYGEQQLPRWRDSRSSGSPWYDSSCRDMPAGNACCESHPLGPGNCRYSPGSPSPPRSSSRSPAGYMAQTSDCCRAGPQS